MKKNITFIEWKEHYSVGNIIIDNQHRFIVDIINRLYDSLILSCNNSDDDQLISDLKKFTKIHLNYEELMLKKIEYANFEDHLKDHEVMKTKIISIENELTAGEDEIRSKVFLFLRSWWLDHILIKDMAYVDSIKSHT